MTAPNGARLATLPPEPVMPLPSRAAAQEDRCAACSRGDHGKCRDERAGGSGIPGIRCGCSLCYRDAEAPVDNRTALQVQRDRAEAAEALLGMGSDDPSLAAIRWIAAQATQVPQARVVAGRIAATAARAAKSESERDALARLLADLYRQVDGCASLHACRADVLGCEVCALTERVEAALRGQLRVPGDAEPALPSCGLLTAGRVCGVAATHYTDADGPDEERLYACAAHVGINPEWSWKPLTDDTEPPRESAETMLELVHLGLLGIGETACGQPIAGPPDAAGPRFATMRESVTCPTCQVTPSAGPGWRAPVVDADGNRIRDAERIEAPTVAGEGGS